MVDRNVINIIMGSVIFKKIHHPMKRYSFSCIMGEVCFHSLKRASRNIDATEYVAQSARNSKDWQTLRKDRV